jgi:hypothetical protein
LRTNITHTRIEVGLDSQAGGSDILLDSAISILWEISRTWGEA